MKWPNKLLLCELKSWIVSVSIWDSDILEISSSFLDCEIFCILYRKLVNTAISLCSLVNRVLGRMVQKCTWFLVQAAFSLSFCVSAQLGAFLWGHWQLALCDGPGWISLGSESKEECSHFECTVYNDQALLFILMPESEWAFQNYLRRRMLALTVPFFNWINGSSLWALLAPATVGERHSDETQTCCW